MTSTELQAKISTLLGTVPHIHEVLVADIDNWNLVQLFGTEALVYAYREEDDSGYMYETFYDILFGFTFGNTEFEVFTDFKAQVIEEIEDMYDFNVDHILVIPLENGKVHPKVLDYNKQIWDGEALPLSTADLIENSESTDFEDHFVQVELEESENSTNPDNIDIEISVIGSSYIIEDEYNNWDFEVQNFDREDSVYLFSALFCGLIKLSS